MKNNFIFYLIILFIIAIFFIPFSSLSYDLPEIKKNGVLRHLGVPYANFVTGAGDGFSVELIKLFAAHLGVKYKFVKSDWKHIISDLTGKKVVVHGCDVKVVGNSTIRGDIIATGFTILCWRKKIVDFSDPTFPTQIWLIASANSSLKPIVPTGDLNKDIKKVLIQLKGYTILSVKGTCLDSSLYGVENYGAKVIVFNKLLNELAPAVINGVADATLLDVPDALIALEKFPGQIKVIGPVSPPQHMACAFEKTSPLLRSEFNKFLAKIKKNGEYLHLVKKYYPSVVDYYPKFFGQDENDK